eukprot:jgi/Phyca11/102140/e_gw1.6.614.1
MPSEPRYTLAARTRVLEAFRHGEDWLLVAHHNALPATTARRIITSGSPEVKARGGDWTSVVKCAPEIEADMVGYVEENCLYTLVQLQQMVEFDFGARLSTSLISQKLCGKLYTTKQVSLYFVFQKQAPKVLYYAAFVDAVYETAKAHETYQNDFAESIVIVLDNAPAHSQTEGLVCQRSDLMLLRQVIYCICDVAGYYVRRNMYM